MFSTLLITIYRCQWTTSILTVQTGKAMTGPTPQLPHHRQQSTTTTTTQQQRHRWRLRLPSPKPLPYSSRSYQHQWRRTRMRNANEERGSRCASPALSWVFFAFLLFYWNFFLIRLRELQSSRQRPRSRRERGTPGHFNSSKPQHRSSSSSSGSRRDTSRATGMFFFILLFILLH